jgi:hypothetical protein
MVHHPAQLGLNPFLGEAELFEGVFMFALELALLLGGAGIEPTLETTPVVGHQLPSFLRRERVLESRFPEFVHVQEQEENRLGHEGVNEEAVVLFRLNEPELV